MCYCTAHVLLVHAGSVHALSASSAVAAGCTADHADNGTACHGNLSALDMMYLVVEHVLQQATVNLTYYPSTPEPNTYSIPVTYTMLLARHW